MNIATIRPYLSTIIQVLVWITLGVMLLILHPLTWNIDLPTQFWLLQGLIFGTYVGLYYLNAKVLVPRFLFNNKSWLFIFFALAAGIIIYLVIDFVGSGLNVPELMHQARHPNGGGGRRGGRNNGINATALFFGGMILLILFISTTVAALQKYQQENQAREELEKAKISSELSFLKAQINPHFFFNTLNNIYALTMFNVALAQEALHTLSRMMRYVLYDTPSEQTVLSKELAFIQDYIDLMKLRLTDKVEILFEQPVPLKDVAIAPMLLLPFIENAFKFGVSTESPSSIFIGIAQNPTTLTFTVRNTVFSQKRVALEGSNGIGLINTRRRLDLIYPGQYTLGITEQNPDNEYVVLLTIAV